MRARSGLGRQRPAGSSAGTRAGTPSSRLASSSAITTLPPASSAASAGPGRARAWVKAAASSEPLSQACSAQDRARAAHRLGQPRGGSLRELGAPGRDVQDRNRVAGDRVANRDAGADPLVEAAAPVLGAVDQHRPRGLERGAHPVRAGRPLRPARPRRHVALARAAQRVLVALHGQDPTGAVGDGDDAADVLDLARDRRCGAAELGEHDLVLERVLRGRLVLRRGGRGSG